MESALGLAQEAAIGFVRQLTEDDLAAVFDFASRVQVAQEFTNDADALEAAIRARVRVARHRSTTPCI